MNNVIGMPNEYSDVERQLIDQFKRMGWQHFEGDTDVPYVTVQRSFSEVLLLCQLRGAVRRTNPDLVTSRVWMTHDGDIVKKTTRLPRLAQPSASDQKQHAHRGEDARAEADCVARAHPLGDGGDAHRA